MATTQTRARYGAGPGRTVGTCSNPTRGLSEDDELLGPRARAFAAPPGRDRRETAGITASTLQFVIARLNADPCLHPPTAAAKGGVPAASRSRGDLAGAGQGDLAEWQRAGPGPAAAVAAEIANSGGAAGSSASVGDDPGVSSIVQTAIMGPTARAWRREVPGASRSAVGRETVRSRRAALRGRGGKTAGARR